MFDQTTRAVKKVKKISFRLVVVLTIFAFIFLLFLLITDKIILKNEKGFDNSIFRFLSHYTTPAVTNEMIFFTFFGSIKFLFPAYCILVLYYLFFKKNTFRSFNIAAIGLSSVALLFLIKDIFKRHRPANPLLADVKGFSYPSGHSFSAFTFCGLLIYILWEIQINNWLKWAGTLVLFLFASLIAASRVYLHVHYASDVVAGFCLSLLWLTICIFILNKFEKKKQLKQNENMLIKD